MTNMQFKNGCLVFLFTIMPAKTIFAQFTKGINYKIEVSTTFSGGEYAPFWLTNNRYGLSSVENNNGYIRAGVFRPLEKDKNFSYGFGLDLAGAYYFTSPFIVQQVYADLKFYFFNLTIGSKEHPMELKNQELSSGSMTFSKNARPVPQVRIEMPEYVAIPGTKELFSVKGHLAYGIFTDDNWQKDFIHSINYKHTSHVLYHSKSLLFKIGNEQKFPLIFEGGLEMAAQFGGKSIRDDKIVNMPNSIKDFFKALVPSGGSDNSPLNEQTNIYGNHLGSWLFSLSYKFPSWKLRTYYDHFFEDQSMMFGQYGWKDCLAGMEITLPPNKFINTIIYEYIGTKDQSGPIFHDSTPIFPDQISAVDDYYNHSIYTGWQHWGMGIGNPLIISPIYNKDGQIIFKSNRMIAHHIGFAGTPFEGWNYKVLFSYAKHWGTYSDPLSDEKKNINALLEVTYRPKPLKDWEFAISVATDGGNLIEHNFGGMLKICKTGLLSKNK